MHVRDSLVTGEGACGPHFWPHRDRKLTLRFIIVRFKRFWAGRHATPRPLITVTNGGNFGENNNELVPETAPRTIALQGRPQTPREATYRSVHYIVTHA